MRILYCEDDLDTGEAFRIGFTQLGHHVDYAQTADQAIAMFDVSGAHPYDLLITDVEMSGHLGLVFAAHARRNGYEGRIVVLTGHSKDTFAGSLQEVRGEYWQKTALGQNLREMVEGV